jgi:hypothetical protein
MGFSVRLFAPDGAGDAAQAQAERRFARALTEALGDESLVWPVFEAARALQQRYGDNPDPHALTTEEFLLLSQWQQAENAALEAVFGPHRHLDEGGYDILPA